MQKFVCAEEMKVSWAEIKERVNITIYGFDILLLKIPNQRGKTFFFFRRKQSSDRYNAPVILSIAISCMFFL